MNLRLLLFFSTLMLSNACFAETGLEILEKMEDYQRSISNSSFIKSKLSSCKYGIKNKKIVCAEKPRVKLLEAVGINEGEKLRDTKTVTIVLEPASEKGVGMLNFTYDETGKDNETWLYLSALGRVKRIASGNSDDDSEPASLFGSEFTTEDTDTGKLDEYTINLLEETTVSNRPVWKIETIPNTKRAKKTRYARTLIYVDKERYVPLRLEMYDKQDKEIKRSLSTKVEQIKSIWTARSQTMLNLVTNRLSNMVRQQITVDVTIPNNVLTQRTLTDVAFREAQLAMLRARIEWSSRPRELPPQSLTEPYVRLSPHTALHVPRKLPSLHISKAPPICSWLMIYFGHVSPFAPFPLQKLLHYYELIRPCAPLRYFLTPWVFHS